MPCEESFSGPPPLPSECQPTDPPTITATSSPAIALYNGLLVADMSAAESISIIRSLIHSPHQIAAARSLRGKDAQGLIEFIDQVIPPSCSVVTLLGLGKLNTPCRSLHCQSWMRSFENKICKTCETLPASYILRQECISIGSVRYYGGFADVSEGQYLGCRVAIKHLRIGMKDASNTVFKVLKF